MSHSDMHNEGDDRCKLSSSDAAALDTAFGGEGEAFISASGSGSRALGILGLLRLSRAEERALDESRPEAIGQAMLVASRLSSGSERSVDCFASGEEPVETLRVLQLLDEPLERTESGRAARIERVLAALPAKAGATRPFRMTPPTSSEVGARRGIRFSDFIAVAAVLLVGTTILFPQLFSVRTMAEEIQCAQNMQRAGVGFSMFANEHDGQLPARDIAGEGSDSQPRVRTAQWWLVGNPNSSHSANLFVLVRQDYVPLEALACPGNRRAAHDDDHTLEADWQSPEQVSYSYQLFGDRPPRFSDQGVNILLADRSPVIQQAMQGQIADATQNSLNHRERGQNILLPDLSVYFAYTPELQTRSGQDNIWIPRSFEGNPRQVRLTGSERPAPNDAFVGP
ncbi:MAG: hypothetical protein ACIAQF_10005 [Phycisphaerales bacterium JB065]